MMRCKICGLIDSSNLTPRCDHEWLPVGSEPEIEDEIQARRNRAMRDAVDKIMLEAPRQINTHLYIRSIAIEAYAAGWNAKAEEMKGGSKA